MKTVFICSPLRAATKEEFDANIEFARKKCRAVALAGYNPYASHVFATQFLDDSVSEERLAGRNMGMEMLKRADEMWVFGSRISKGMEAEIKTAEENNIPVKYFS